MRAASDVSRSKASSVGVSSRSRRWSAASLSRSFTALATRRAPGICDVISGVSKALMVFRMSRQAARQVILATAKTSTADGAEDRPRAPVVTTVPFRTVAL